MTKNSRNKKVSQQTVEDAEDIAKATQRPGQTKEQTKLIAQGIQKGIEQYKKKQKSKSRELNKKQSKLKKQQDALFDQNREHENHEEVENEHQSAAKKLPWFLLAGSWTLFLIYIYLTGF